MLTRPIPSTAEPLPVIGLGSYQTFDVGAYPAAQAGPRAVMQSFVDAGGALIDSSPMYGNAETAIGNCMAALQLREKCFIATKVWTSGRDAGIRQMQESSAKLQTKTIDLMQVHNLLDVETHLATLKQWKQEGRVRYVGVTHYTASGHSGVEKALQAHRLDFVQINYSPVEREAERRLLPLAAERGAAVIVNRPFAGGTLLKRRRPELPPWAIELECNSWAQLILKFIVSHPAVTCVIPATGNAIHLRDFAQAGMGLLPSAEMRERIAAAVQT